MYFHSNVKEYSSKFVMNLYYTLIFGLRFNKNVTLKMTTAYDTADICWWLLNMSATKSMCQKTQDVGRFSCG